MRRAYNHGDKIIMPVINFIKSDGSTAIEAKEGANLMEVGRDANMGVEGTCGGSLSCATCHVIFDGQASPLLVAPLKMRWICLIWHLA